MACSCDIYRERIALLEARQLELICETHSLRRLWQGAAACLQHNRIRIKPRGPDEKAVLAAAEKADLGTMWSGKTKGWVSE